ncbi:MAG: methyltransferase domain-containing protein [Limisphaerales bacterium]
MSESNDSSRPEFWNMRYASGKTPWDFHGVPATLNAFLKTSAPGKVLIPGCGTGYEVRAFHQAGWEVTAIDFSAVAVEQARGVLGELGHCVELADFFKYGRGESFDLVYERTFLCTLPPNLWESYADRVAQLLRLSGRLVGIFLYGEEPEPPPYPLTESRAKALFGEKFSRLRSLPVEDSLPLFIGKERWQEWKRIR